MTKQSITGTAAGSLNAITAEEMKNTIVELYLNGNRDSILELGGVGVGKSEAVRQAAREIAKRMDRTYFEYSAGKEIPKNPFVFVDLRLPEIEPTDIGGIPRDAPDGETMIYKPLKYVKMLSQNPGILFLDEITNETRPNMKAASYKILNELRMGDYKLHQDAIVVAAGNKPEEAVGLAEALPFPMASRLTIYNMRVPELHEWVQYMDTTYARPVFDDNGKPVIDKQTKKQEIKTDWDRRVVAYLMRYEGHFYQLPKESYTLENFPTPRSWTKVAAIAHKYQNHDGLEKFTEGRLGAEIGRQFIQFINTKVEPLEVYLKNHEKWKQFGNDVAGKYLLSVEIADKWSKMPAIDDLCHTILQSDREGLTVIFTMLRADDKNEVVRRMLKKDRTIIEFLKKLSGYKYGTSDE